MTLKILKVLFSLITIIACSSGNESNGWIFGPWTSFNRPVERGFNREFDEFQYAFGEPQQAASDRQQYNRLTFYNPFVSQSSSYPYAFSPKLQNPAPAKIIVPQNVPAGNYNSPRYSGLQYAPNHMQPETQNQKYSVPAAPQRYSNEYRQPLNTVNRYKGNNLPAPYANNGPIRKQYQPYRPYETSRVNLNQYYNDPYINKIKSDVIANEISLKQSEAPERNSPQVAEGGDESAESENDENSNIHRNQEQENFVPQYEPYVPQNQPHYYDRPVNRAIDRDHIVKNVRYPRPNHENAKIHPAAYDPLRNHIENLRQNQGNTFTDEKSDYPAQKASDESDDHSDGGPEPEGHDIYDRQKTEFDHQNANFVPNFNQFTEQHHPNAKVLPENSNYSVQEEEENDEVDENNPDDFIPVKTYAQVRHTETTKHLPRDAAYEDAVTYDDIINAPRLRESIKTTKAQTVYTEEGYEDGAYDHAGHLKHASNQEGHGGFSKDQYVAGNKGSDSDRNAYADSGRSKHGSDDIKGKKWFVDEGKHEDFGDHQSYSARDGSHESIIRDLAQAGSEKSGATNTTFAPKDQYHRNMRKLVMSSSIEKKYEQKPEVANIKNENRLKSPPSNINRNRGLAQQHKVIGNHLKKALQYNYAPEMWTHVNMSKVNRYSLPAVSDVEVFGENFQINQGPKHGGNYKQTPILDMQAKKWALYGEYDRDILRTSDLLPAKENVEPDDLSNVNRHLTKQNVDNRLRSIRANNSFVETIQPLVADSSKEAININEDTIEILEDPREQPNKKSEKLLQLPGHYKNVYATEDGEEIIRDKDDENKYEDYTRSGSEGPSYPTASDIEVFRPGFKRNRGPKHGGNYKKITSNKSGRKNNHQAGELDDLNSYTESSQSSLHGGNYRTQRELI